MRLPASRAQPPPAAGRATPWPGPPCDRPPQPVRLGRGSKATPPDQHRVPRVHPSPTSSSSRVNVRPLRRSQRRLRRPRRRPDGDEVSHGFPRQDFPHSATMGRPACSWAALVVLLLIATCLAGFAVRARFDVVGFSAAASVAPCAAVSESTPPMPSAFSTPPPVLSAFRFCDSLAHPASFIPVSCGGGFVLGQSAVDCTVSTESPLGSPLAPSIRLGGDLASLKIGSPAEIPPSSGAGDGRAGGLGVERRWYGESGCGDDDGGGFE